MSKPRAASANWQTEWNDENSVRNNSHTAWFEYKHENSIRNNLLMHQRGIRGLMFSFARTAAIGANHQQDGEICNRRGYGGKKESTDKERCNQIPRKLHQRCPVLMRNQIVHGLGDGIPRKSLADDPASDPTLRRIDENDRNGICYQRSGQRANLRATQKEGKRKRDVYLKSER